MITPSVPRVGHLIAGETTIGDLRDVHDPGRLDEVVAEVAVGTVVDVDRAVRAAHDAFGAWRKVPPAGHNAYERIFTLVAGLLPGARGEGALFRARRDVGAKRRAQQRLRLRRDHVGPHRHPRSGRR